MGRKLHILMIYAREDKDIAITLLHHLNSLKPEFDITIWHDDPILPGKPWKPQTGSRLDKTEIFILLVSADFMSSQFINQIECNTIVERYKENKSVIIPIIIDDCQWDIDLKLADYKFNIKELEVLPVEGKPLWDWKSPDQAYNTISAGIKKAIATFADLLEPEDMEEDKKDMTTKELDADREEIKSKKEEKDFVTADEEIDAVEEPALLSDSAEENRLWEEAEAKRRAEMAKRIREAAEESARRREEEEIKEEAIRIAQVEKRIREAAEAAANRRVEEEKSRIEEAEAKKKAVEDKRIRDIAEARATQHAAEEQKKRIEEAEATKKTAEEKRMKDAAEETARLKAREEEKFIEEAEATQKTAEEKRIKDAAEEKARLKAREEERLNEDAEATKKAEEEKRIKDAAEATARLKEKEKARLLDEAEAKRTAADVKRSGEVEDATAGRKVEESEAEAGRRANEKNKSKAEEDTWLDSREEKKGHKTVAAAASLDGEKERIQNEGELTKRTPGTENSQHTGTNKGWIKALHFEKNKGIRKRILIGSLVVVIGIAVIWALSLFTTGTEKPTSPLPDTTTTDIKDSIATVEPTTDSRDMEEALLKLGVGDTFEDGIVFTIDQEGKIGKIAYPEDAGPMTWDNAMKINEQLGAEWRLPDFDELVKMHQTIGQGASNSGLFTDELYWSATSYDDHQARLVRFSDGNTSYHYNKALETRKYLVRAIRDISW